MKTTTCAYPWQQMIVDLTGEVVPCCYWSGYGNSGTPLGNTNVDSIIDIWNGKAYREIREKLANNEIKDTPCEKCFAYSIAGNTYPRFSMPGFEIESGYCYIFKIEEKLLPKIMNNNAELLENGVLLNSPCAEHDDIRKKGMGHYSVWNGWVYFSTSDNSDPNLNGRRYELKIQGKNYKLSKLDEKSKSGKNILLAVDEYKKGKTELKAKPTMISLISTADCNIDCPACSQNLVRYTKVQHKPETVPDILGLVPYLYLFIWQGGEPYLIKKFRNFIDEFKVQDNPNLSFGFTSNGVMIVPKEAKKLEKFTYLNLSISIDSFNPLTFEKIRKGANFSTVFNNYKRLDLLNNQPVRKINSGMIICKSNILELPKNLTYAIEHNIGLNLSPVVVYPADEQIDVFDNFEKETKGWYKALDDSIEIAKKGLKENCIAFQRVNPLGAINEISSIIHRAEEIYVDYLSFFVTIEDNNDRLKLAKNPYFTVSDRSSGNILSYKKLEGLSKIKINLPSLFLNRNLNLNIIYDINYPGSFLGVHYVQDGELKNNSVINISIIHEEHNIKYLKNIKVANYGETDLKNALFVKAPSDIHNNFNAKWSLNTKEVKEKTLVNSEFFSINNMFKQFKILIKKYK